MVESFFHTPLARLLSGAAVAVAGFGVGLWRGHWRDSRHSHATASFWLVTVYLLAEGQSLKSKV